MLECNCCKKRVAYKDIFTLGIFLFNGCENCYHYLKSLIPDLVKHPITEVKK